MKAILLAFGMGLVSQGVWGNDVPATKNQTVGSWSSGGGNAVVCFDDSAIPETIRKKDQNGNIIDGSLRDQYIPHITSVEILDLYEAKLRRGFNRDSKKLIEPHPGEDIRSYAHRIISRIEHYLPSLYENLMNIYNELDPGEATELPHGMEPVNDYNMIGRINAEYCVIATMILQADVVSKRKTYLYYDSRLWDWRQHSEWSKDIAYLHEIVYRWARKNDQTDSRNSRELVKLLITREITNEQFRNDAEALGFSVKYTLNSFDVEQYSHQYRYDGIGKAVNAIHKELLQHLSCINFPEEFGKISSVAYKAMNEIAQEKVRSAFSSEASCSELNDCLDTLSKIRKNYEPGFMGIGGDEGKVKLADKIIGELRELNKETNNDINEKKSKFMMEAPEAYFISNLQKKVMSIELLTQAEKEKLVTAYLKKIRENKSIDITNSRTSVREYRPWLKLENVYLNGREAQNTVGFEDVGFQQIANKNWCEKSNAYFTGLYNRAVFITEEMFAGIPNEFPIPVIE